MALHHYGRLSVSEYQILSLKTTPAIILQRVYSTLFTAFGTQRMKLARLKVIQDEARQRFGERSVLKP